MTTRLKILLAALFLLLAAAACQGSGEPVGGPVVIRADAAGDFDLKWYEILALDYGRPFRYEISQEAWNAASQQNLDLSGTQVTAVDATFQADGRIRYDIGYFAPELNRDFVLSALFSVTLTTEGDFVVTVESATLTGERGSLNAPPALLNSLNGELLDSLSGQQYSAGDKNIHFTGVEVSEGLLVLEGYLEASE